MRLRSTCSALLAALALASCRPAIAPVQQSAPQTSLEPARQVYRTVEGCSLHAYVFRPDPPAKRASAILLFHGGGWSMGSPEWCFKDARRFADHGMVAIPVEYRLSEGQVTPIEALADVCAAFRWAREHADDLGIDPGRVAGYGVSAGGHLVASAATVGCGGDPPDETGEPDALILWSPALDLTSDAWFAQKLQGRADASDYSPADHVRASTPPTSIVHGGADTLTPLAGAQRYCDRLTAVGGTCSLHAYEGLGHLLTRNLAVQEHSFDPDPEAVADGDAQQLRFLASLGFIAK